jgi:hypothetical protein
MEGVHERYIMPTWPLLVAAPMLALGLWDRGRPARIRHDSLDRGRPPALSASGG